MRWIENLPIRTKLLLIAILTVAVAEIFASGIIAAYTVSGYRQEKTRDVEVQARVLAGSLTASVVFGDVDAAQEYLEALRANQTVAAAGVYDADGSLFARYARKGAPSDLVPQRSDAGAPRFRDNMLMVSQPLMQFERPIGSVYLVVETDSFATLLSRVGGLMLLAAFGSLLIAIPVSIALNRTIVKPIRDIAGAAGRIAAGDLGQEWSAPPRKDEIGVLMRVFGQMVASLRDMMQQERLRALGQLSSGIAHDINNAMTPVALYTDSLLESEPNLAPRLRKYLEIVKRVVDDVRATASRMRDFSRKREPETALTPVDLNSLAPQVIDLTRARWSDLQQRRGVVIDVRTELAADLPNVMGIEAEIREALTNLIFNAIDAMPNGGTITVRTKAEPGAHVRLEVSDTGVGMDEETRRRCFEPFFTTKGEQGTGLGLAMVYGIAQRHNAKVEIESAIGAGTMVRMRFQASSGTMPAVERKAPAPSAQGLHILIVDDDEAVSDSMRTVLELDNHRVMVANAGQAAIDMFHAAQTRGDAFTVVITDLGMPYIDGRQVADAVKAASPATSVILLTGWGNQLTSDGDVPPFVDYVLSKPPDLNELRTVLVRCQAQEPRAAARSNVLEREAADASASRKSSSLGGFSR